MTSATKLVLPMVVLNMGGEMVNILNQRLHAQQVEEEKGRAVLRDVIFTMYSAEFIEELFKPQEMYSDKATREIFSKLAHSSIMRLNGSSMDKLYDLITMGMKYQALSCAQPQQLLLVTLNHLETLKRMVPCQASLIDTVVETTVAAYRHLDTFGWMQLKQRLLECFQGRRVKISLFLQYNVQLPDGTLVLNPQGKLPLGAEPPGIIRYLPPDGTDASVVSLPMSSAESVDGALTTCVDFDSPMGTNIYEPRPNSALDPGAAGFRTKAIEAAAAAVAQAARWRPEAEQPHSPGNARSKESKGGDASTATAGLNLLASLLGASAKEETDGGVGGDDAGAGSAKRRDRRDSFKINLFPDDPFDAAQAKDYDGREASTITIDLAADHTGCAKMLRELDLSDDVAGGVGSRGARSGSKGTDQRSHGGAGTDGRVGAKGEDEGTGRLPDDDDGNDKDEDDDDLLALMDSAAESK